MARSELGSVVEHVVLFNVRDEEEAAEDPTRVKAMVDGLNNLEEVLYLSAGPILRARLSSSSSSPMRFSHMLHARYRSESDLVAYMAHPRHVAVVQDLVKPICDDDSLIAVDWVWSTGGGGGGGPRPGSALRLTLWNLTAEEEEEREDGAEETKNNNKGSRSSSSSSSSIKAVMEGLANMRDKAGAGQLAYPFEQMSYGVTNIHINKPSFQAGEEEEEEEEEEEQEEEEEEEEEEQQQEEEEGSCYKTNFAALVVFPDLNELDACEEYEDVTRSLAQKLKPSLRHLIIVDYVVPRQ